MKNIVNLLSKNNILIIVIIITISLFIYNINKSYPVEKFAETFCSAEKMIKEINIPYAIIYGTALGAYRNKDFIPHDDDIDIMIFHDDLKMLGHKTLKDQQNYINTIAKKYNLIPRNKNSAPYKYVNNGKGMPILYQYNHQKSQIGVDFYIFYKHKDNFWCFVDGGERDLKGYKYPYNKSFFKTKLNIFNTVSCPIELLYIAYGPNMKTPIKKSDKNYYNQKREYFGPFLKEWLMPLE
jgi:LicD family